MSSVSSTHYQKMLDEVASTSTGFEKLISPVLRSLKQGRRIHRVLDLGLLGDQFIRLLSPIGERSPVVA